MEKLFLQLVELAKLQKEAAPGPWHVVGPPWGHGNWISTTQDPHGGRAICDCEPPPFEDEDYEEIGANAAFIAAAGSFDFTALLAAPVNILPEDSRLTPEVRAAARKFSISKLGTSSATATEQGYLEGYTAALSAPTATASTLGELAELTEFNELRVKAAYESAYAKLDSYSAGDRKHQVAMTGDELCAASLGLDLLKGLAGRLRAHPAPMVAADKYRALVADLLKSQRVDDGLKTYIRGVSEKIEAGVAARGAAETGGWVPVAFTPCVLPDKYYSADVLLWYEGTAPAVGYYDYRESYKEYTPYDQDYAGSQPTHWQRIDEPAAPTEATSHREEGGQDA